MRLGFTTKSLTLLEVHRSTDGTRQRNTGTDKRVLTSGVLANWERQKYPPHLKDDFQRNVLTPLKAECDKLEFLRNVYRRKGLRSRYIVIHISNWMGEVNGP